MIAQLFMVLWVTIQGVDIQIFPSDKKACDFAKAGLIQPRVIAIIVDVDDQKTYYRTRVYAVDCNKVVIK